MNLGQNNAATVLNQPFGYPIRFTTLAAGGTSTNNLTTQAQANFVAQKLTMFADVAGAAQTDSSRVLPLCTIQMTDASGNNYFQEATPLPCIFGSAELPYFLTTPITVQARSNLIITLANYSAATTYANVYLFFWGNKVFLDGF